MPHYTFRQQCRQAERKVDQVTLIEKLKAQQAEIGAALRALEDPALRKFLDESKVAAAAGMVAEQPAAAVVAQPQKKQRVMKNRGVRAALLRLLLTGACSTASLSEVAAAKFTRKAITRTLWTMVEEGDATVDASGTYRLTDKGTAEAQYFMAHPEMMIRREA